MFRLVVAAFLVMVALCGAAWTVTIWYSDWLQIVSTPVVEYDVSILSTTGYSEVYKEVDSYHVEGEFLFLKWDNGREVILPIQNIYVDILPLEKDRGTDWKAIFWGRR